ncbi:hypothetical protein [Sphingobacterium sp. UGAL515B_05]|uniref:hypothetical protein n=1 Tax=Sphingobacterium sp. UGAL515B_05 TaxID=2986767 RepID=UPI002953B3C9|nr:hypothetical protein [Sphingobacterium sp. UGAL515B_05]WON94734.1 hypothetical protein OK025_26300 [Sphingobacterium sp. UGAL515B_05]
MKSKQEVIQQHYIDLLNADKFFKLKPHIDEDGWCLMFDEKGEKVSLTFKELGFEKDPLGKTVAGGLTQKGHKWRPKSLAGLETNNGWTIADVTKLPTEGIYNVGYFLDDGTFHLGNDEVEWYELREYVVDFGFTHYQPIIKPEDPIY